MVDLVKVEEEILCFVDRFSEFLFKDEMSPKCFYKFWFYSHF